MSEDSSPYPEVHKHLTTPEAMQLAELYLVQGDLDAAYATLSLYFDQFAFSEQPRSAQINTISSSLFRDGVLLYCSCFSTKDRSKLEPKAVYGHLDDWESRYQKLLDIRDAFVAHNFGPQRQHAIVVIGLEIGGELIPAGFSQVFMRFAGWVAVEGKQLLPFIDIAREHLKKRIEDAEKPVAETIASLTSAEFSALPDIELSAPMAEDFRISRSRFRKSGRGERVRMPPNRWGRTIVDGLNARRPDPAQSDSKEEDPG